MPEEKSPKHEVIVTVDGVPVKDYVDEQIATEIEKVSKREISEKSVGINPKITTKFNQNTSGSKSERRDYASNKVYSQETLADMNYKLQVQQSQGGRPMEASAVLPLPQQGSIEIALDDARKKAKFFLAEKSRAEAEYERWNTVAIQLESALALVTGKAVVQSREGRVTSPKGTWTPIILEALSAGPATRKELITHLQEKGAPSVGAAYQAVRNCEKRGEIKLLDGKRYKRVAMEEKEENENEQ